MYSKHVVIPITDSGKDIITYVYEQVFLFCWMVNGILFHINGPLHKKLLDDFTVREVK